VILVDVGVWVAGAWRRHTHNAIAERWLNAQDESLALCRIAQMGLLRLLSNPVVLGKDTLTRREAWLIVDDIRSDERVVWVDEPTELDGVWRAISARRETSHKLWTDDYLAAFAQTTGASLATLDRKMADRYPSIRVISLLD
jgi:uncharacterized protein